jgi:hypothetical protein
LSGFTFHVCQIFLGNSLRTAGAFAPDTVGRLMGARTLDWKRLRLKTKRIRQTAAM